MPYKPSTAFGVCCWGTIVVLELFGDVCRRRAFCNNHIGYSIGNIREHGDGVAKEAEAALLDLSSHDYDKYYLRDVTHLGWEELG